MQTNFRPVVNETPNKWRPVENSHEVIETHVFVRVYMFCRGPGSVVGIATAYGLDGPGIESFYGELPGRKVVLCGVVFPCLAKLNWRLVKCSVRRSEVNHGRPTTYNSMYFRPDKPPHFGLRNT